MIQTPPAFLRDFLVTDRTLPFLFSPECTQLSPFEPVLLPLRTNTFVEVAFPGWIIRICFPLNEAMPSDRDFCCFHQVDDQHFSLLSFNFAREGPFPGADFMKVFLLHPPSPFGWMSPLCPSPEHLENGMVHGAEGLLACHMSVVQRPSPQNRV